MNCDGIKSFIGSHWSKMLIIMVMVGLMVGLGFLANWIHHIEHVRVEYIHPEHEAVMSDYDTARVARESLADKLAAEIQLLEQDPDANKDQLIALKNQLYYNQEGTEYGDATRDARAKKVAMEKFEDDHNIADKYRFTLKQVSDNANGWVWVNDTQTKYVSVDGDVLDGAFTAATLTTVGITTLHAYHQEDSRYRSFVLACGMLFLIIALLFSFKAFRMENLYFVNELQYVVYAFFGFAIAAQCGWFVYGYCYGTEPVAPVDPNAGDIIKEDKADGLGDVRTEADEETKGDNVINNEGDGCPSESEGEFSDNTIKSDPNNADNNILFLASKKKTDTPSESKLIGEEASLKTSGANTNSRDDLEPGVRSELERCSLMRRLLSSSRHV